MTYEEYLKEQEEVNQQALSEQSAKTNAAMANALGSAAVAYNDMKAIATSGGYSDVKSEYTPITEKDINQQPLPQVSDQARNKVAGDGEQTQAEGIGAKPRYSYSEDEETIEDVNERLKEAQEQKEQADADYVKTVAEDREEWKGKFDQWLLEEKARQDKEKEEMAREEQGNTIATMATGATELAAGIINMLSVGQLHANNQQYKNYSQDWMRKADQDIKEHRRRSDNMQAVLDRLKMQQQQVASAKRIEEMNVRRQAANEALKVAAANEQLEYERQKDAEAKERQERLDKERTALNRAQIVNIYADNAARDEARKDKQRKEALAMATKGFVPDESSPIGYRYDREAASKLVPLGEAKEGVSLPLNSYGNLPAETIQAPDFETIAEVLWKNIDSIDDVDKKTLESIRSILLDDEKKIGEKKEDLTRVIIKSEKARQLFRRSGLMAPSEAQASSGESLTDILDKDENLWPKQPMPSYPKPAASGYDLLRRPQE